MPILGFGTVGLLVGWTRRERAGGSVVLVAHRLLNADYERAHRQLPCLAGQYGRLPSHADTVAGQLSTPSAASSTAWASRP